MLEALVDNQKYLGPARCHIRALQGKRNCVITSRVVSAYPSGNHVVWAWIPHSCAGESVPRPKPSSLEEKPGDSAWSLHVNQPAQGHRTPSAQSPEKQEGPQGFPQIFGIRRNGAFPDTRITGATSWEVLWCVCSLECRWGDTTGKLQTRQRKKLRFDSCDTNARLTMTCTKNWVSNSTTAKLLKSQPSPVESKKYKI